VDFGCTMPTSCGQVALESKRVQAKNAWSRQCARDTRPVIDEWLTGPASRRAQQEQGEIDRSYNEDPADERAYKVFADGSSA